MMTVPDGWGPDALEFLKLNGLTPRIDRPIRASSLDLALACPFGFYLREILGLSSPYRWSKALSRGSWAHKRLECIYHPNPQAYMDEALRQRHTELTRIHNTLGVGAVSEDLQRILDRETRDRDTSMAWFEAASSLPLHIDSRSITFPQYLSSFKWLGAEILLSSTHPDFPKRQLLARLDALLYDEKTNQLWILDFKTCAESPVIRLSSCPIEFQTQHYLYILNEVLWHHLPTLKKLIPAFPHNPTIAGMMHLALQKPTINFDPRVDRPFEFVPRILKSGPRKGLEIVEKKYLSEEPLYSLYLERVRRWYAATHEYEDLAPSRVNDPPVNISFTPYGLALDADGLAQYHARLSHIHSLLERAPYPGNFIRNPRMMRAYDEMTSLAPFYVCAPFQWPDIIAQKNLIQTYRDDHIEPLTTGAIECLSSLSTTESS